MPNLPKTSSGVPSSQSSMNLLSQLQVLRIEAPKLATACTSLLSTLRQQPRRRGAISGLEPCQRGWALHLCRAAAEPSEGAVEGDGASPAPVPTSAIGQVMAAQANFVRVKVERLDGDDGASGGAAAAALPPPPRSRLLCVVRGLLKKMKREVLVGDYVRVVGIDWADGRGMVEEVLPRQSRLAEPAVANVSHVVLVFSLARPPFAPGPATRYLLGAEAAGLPVTLLLNKSDLLEEEEVQAVVSQVKSWGYDAVPVSVASGRGMRELGERLQGRVSVLAGPSGAGKSSIINVLRDAAAQQLGAGGAAEPEPPAPECSDESDSCASDDEEGQPAAQGGGGLTSGSSLDDGDAGFERQAVGEVSERIGRGKHTTRNVTLLEMGPGGGLLADTPGFNQPDISALPAAELARHFPEIQAVLEAQRCAFADCRHLAEPGCAVREAGLERYEMYTELHAELRAAAEEEVQRVAGKRQREGNIRFKSRAGGKQGAEARLESKSHRRESRRSVNQWLSDLTKEAEDNL